MTHSNAQDPAMKQFSEQIKAAAHERQTIQISGNQSKVPLYEEAQPLNIGDYTGVVSYDPAELVITVKAGTLLAEVKAVLAENNQMLGFEPPEYGHSTIGGTFACALSGPARPFRGRLRDFVLGTQLIDGQGREMRFGGKMIKNVAGYDISRLLCGSRGSLALVTEISFRVVPQKPEQTYCIKMPEGEAILLMNQMQGTALPLTGCAYYAGHFYYRVAGEHPTQTNRVEVAACDNSIWTTLNPFMPELKPEQKLWRLDVDSTNPAIENTIAIGMGGTRRWVASATKPNHAYVTLWQSRFEPRDTEKPCVKRIKTGIKKVFDPYAVFRDL